MRITLSYLAVFLFVSSFVTMGFFNMPLVGSGLLILAIVVALIVGFIWEKEMIDNGHYFR